MRRVDSHIIIKASLAIGAMVLFNMVTFPEACNAVTSVSSLSELGFAMGAGETEFELADDLVFSGSLGYLIPNNARIVIDGKGKTIRRTSESTAPLFTVPASSELTLKNVIEDGGANKWSVSIEDMVLQSSNQVRFPVNLNGDTLSSASLIRNNGTLNLVDAQFYHNASSAGGSVITNDGVLNIDASRFEKNVSSAGGGVIVANANSSVTIQKSVFSGNLSGTETVSSAGGVLSLKDGASLEMRHSVVSNNLAQHNGGFAYVSDGNILLEGNTFENNGCGNDGAVIAIEGSGTEKGRSIESKNNTYKNNTGYAKEKQSLGGVFYFGSRGVSYNEILFDGDLFEGNSSCQGGAISTYNGGSAGNPDLTFSFNIRNSTFKDNAAQANTGAISIVVAKKVTIEDSVFSGNETEGSVGTIHFRYIPNVAIRNTIVENSKALSYSALYFYGNRKVELDSVTVKNNIATKDTGVGAVYLGNNNDVTMKSSTIEGNTASSNYPAGIYAANNGSMLIESSTISKNSAKNSGGMVWSVNNSGPDNSTLNLRNSIIKENAADEKCGGIYIAASKNDANISIENTTIVSNSAGTYGGGLVTKLSQGSVVNTDENSKIYSNIAGVGGDDIYAIAPEEGESGVLHLMNAAQMNVDGIDNWYIDTPDERYTDGYREINSELSLSASEPIYLKAADGKEDLEEEPTPINPATGDVSYTTELVVAMIGLCAIVGINVIRRR